MYTEKTSAVCILKRQAQPHRGAHCSTAVVGSLNPGIEKGLEIAMVAPAQLPLNSHVWLHSLSCIGCEVGKHEVWTLYSHKSPLKLVDRVLAALRRCYQTTSIRLFLLKFSQEL